VDISPAEWLLGGPEDDSWGYSHWRQDYSLIDAIEGNHNPTFILERKPGSKEGDTEGAFSDKAEGWADNRPSADVVEEQDSLNDMFFLCLIP